MPTLSIITITYQNLAGIKRTVQSIDYKLDGIEHIVIDGLSEDGTLQFLKNIDTKSLKWISEKDNGIYDAMNKGLDRATGKYVIFMNAGDQFHNQHTLRELLEILQADAPDVLYGDTMMVNESYEPIGLRSRVTTRHLPNQLTWKSLKKGMLVCHQSFIVRKDIAPRYVSDNLSADIDWEIKCLKKSKKIARHANPISNFLTGGVSQQRHFESLQDRFKVMTSHYGWFDTLLAHAYFVLRGVAFKIKSIFMSQS